MLQPCGLQCHASCANARDQATGNAAAHARPNPKPSILQLRALPVTSSPTFTFSGLAGARCLPGPASARPTDMQRRHIANPVRCAIPASALYALSGCSGSSASPYCTALWHMRGGSLARGPGATCARGAPARGASARGDLAARRAVPLAAGAVARRAAGRPALLGALWPHGQADPVGGYVD